MTGKEHDALTSIGALSGVGVLFCVVIFLARFGRGDAWVWVLIGLVLSGYAISFSNRRKLPGRNSRLRGMRRKRRNLRRKSMVNGEL